jgi:Lon protease-like protein
MFDLPLFPLNSVLFPGMPLSLHIFEDRYKIMIGQCIQDRRPFGVVLIKEGAEALGPPAEPYEIGCGTRITKVERLEQGRMNILVVGRWRFRIVSLDYQLPYLLGKVELYPLGNQEPQVQAQAAQRLRPWVERYLALLSKSDSDKVEPRKVPRAPMPLAYLAAAALRIPPPQKQQLLEIERATTLLTDMRALYRREIAILKVLLQQPNVDQGSFSLN